MISRPLVAGALTGWLLGDPVTGLEVGAMLELFHLAGMPAELISRAKEVLSRLEQNDLSFTQSMTRKRKGRADDSQMPLFVPQPPTPKSVEPPFVKELRGLDLSQMTPLEALVKLDAWKREVEAKGEEERA